MKTDGSRQSDPSVRVSALAMSGGTAAFRWTPALGGLYAFQAFGFRETHAPQALAWYSMYVVTSGTVVLRRADEEWVATPGTVVLLPPDEIFARSFSVEGGSSFRGLFPTRKALRAVRTGLLPRALRFRSPVSDDPELAAHLLAAHEGLARAHPSTHVALFERALERVRSHHLLPEPDRERREHRAVRMVKDRLSANQGEIPSLSSLAEMASISRFHLSRVFRATEGLTPYAWFEQLRIARARYFIHGGASLAHTTFAAGFADQSHLTRQFKALVGMTPGAYARAVRAARAAPAECLTRNRRDGEPSQEEHVVRVALHEVHDARSEPDQV